MNKFSHWLDQIYLPHGPGVVVDNHDFDALTFTDEPNREHRCDRNQLERYLFYKQ